jgi:hypothetical protein
MINVIKDRFYRLEVKERQQILFIIIFAVVGSYGLTASMLWEQMFQAEKMANRKANRIETRLDGFKTPEIDASLTQERFDNKQQELMALEKQLINFSAKLLPLDDPQPQEKIKLALARIAANNGIAITALTASNADIKAMPEKLTGAALRDILQNRPLFQVSSQGSYQAFLNFSQQLKQLPFYSVMRSLTIEQLPLDSEAFSATNGLLSITFELQM